MLAIGSYVLIVLVYSPFYLLYASVSHWVGGESIVEIGFWATAFVGAMVYSFLMAMAFYHFVTICPWSASVALDKLWLIDCENEDVEIKEKYDTGEFEEAANYELVAAFYSLDLDREKTLSLALLAEIRRRLVE